MKHLKRNDCQKEISIAINEYYCYSKSEKDVKTNFSQNVISRSKKKSEKIKNEIDRAYEEYYSLINEDNVHQNDIDEREQYVYCRIYKRNKKRAIRRKKSNKAKIRLIKKLKIAEKSFKKRFEEDLNNLMYHSSDNIKSRVERYNNLNKRVRRFQQ